MQIKVIYRPKVRVKRDVVRHRDLLACQVRVPGGCVLDSLKICPDPNNPNRVDVTCDMDPYISNGLCRTKEEWHDGNPVLAAELQDDLDFECKKDTAEGVDYEREHESFNWPNGLKSTINPIDPHQIGFRKHASGMMDSLYEIKQIPVKGIDGDTVCSCFVVTAFFFVDTPVLVRAGGGLRLKTPSPQTAKRARGPGDDDEEMADAGGGKPRARGGGAKKPGIFMSMLGAVGLV